MHIVIYFNEKPLIICNQQSEETKQLLQQPGTIQLNNVTNSGINDLIDQIKAPEVKGIVVIQKDAEGIFAAFKQQLKLIQAAGGLVHTENDTILLIYRLKKWDLPKGKLDEGESLEECALREVMEECGLEHLQLEAPLCITYHTYYQDNQLILKESHWYLMNSPEQQVLLPQTEEDIEKCVWVNINDLATYTDNTHASIIDVLKAATKKLKATKEL